MAGVALLVLTTLLAAAEVGGAAAPVVPEAVLDGDPVTRPPPAAKAEAGAAKGSATADPALLALQPAAGRLYAALKGGASDEELEKLLAAAVRELDVNCPRVKEYQVYRSTSRARTLKVKCIERPLYAVTVGASGEGFVSGGDGTIGPMRLADGPIKAILGVRVEEYLAETRANDAEIAETEALLDEDIEHPARRWLARIAGAIGVVFASWLAFIALRERRRHRRSLSRWRGLDSDMKDQLVAESEEVYPNLYRHPEGVFIARGRRGKRRLFSSLVFGYLYSSRGIKLFEIR